jgi:DNA anti-recombination protein RmuC
MSNLSFETWGFIAAILIGGVISHLRFTEKSAHDAPGILITIGIFATFYGIASGLYTFDVDNIESSLPRLISGIKFAFWASVVGVGAAVTLKVRYAFFGSTDSASDVQEGATIDDLVVHLKSSSDSLVRLQNAIAGEEDSSMLTQLKLTRSDQNDRLDGLKRAFQEFAEKQAENNSKALIEALREVIQDFNEKIHEQFGENFKQLNQAVGKINDWQELYRQQMGEMIEQQKQTAIDMKKASESFGALVDNANEFSYIADDLKLTIETMGMLEKALEENLKALAILVESAKTGIPTIERKVLEIVTDIGNGAKASANVIESQVKQSTSEQANAIKAHGELITRNLQDMHSTLDKQVSTIGATLEASAHQMAISVNTQNDINKRSIESLSASVMNLAGALVEQVTSSTKQLSNAVEKQNADVATSIQNTSIQLQQHVSALSEELAKSIQRHNETIGNNISEMSRRTEQQVLALDTALASALTKSLDSLGQQLGALSTKFVQDYGPLTDNLREVVRLAQNIRTQTP